MSEIKEYISQAPLSPHLHPRVFLVDQKFTGHSTGNHILRITKSRLSLRNLQSPLDVGDNQCLHVTGLALMIHESEDWRLQGEAGQALLGGEKGDWGVRREFAA